MFLFLIVSDEFEEAVEHFANAFAVHPKPHEALKAMLDILPPGMIQLIESLIPVVKEVSGPSLFRLINAYLLMFVS